MSYKHNNLMAMRINYWSDTTNPNVLLEKQFLVDLLLEHSIYDSPTLDDAKYFFFKLPSIVIVKGYALGFQHNNVKHLILNFLDENRATLKAKNDLKIQYRM